MTGSEVQLSVWTDDVVYVIAESPYEAVELYAEEVGESPDSCDHLDLNERVDDNSTIPIWCRPDGSIAEIREPGSKLVMKTAAEWAERGKGFLCTFEE